MSKTLETTFDITEMPGSTVIAVETYYLVIKTSSTGWTAKKKITYQDNTIDVILVMRGQKGEKYEMTMEINAAKKDIKATLATDGKNRIILSYPTTDFNFQP